MKPKILQMVSKMRVKIYVNASSLAKHLRPQHPDRYKKVKVRMWLLKGLNSLLPPQA